MAKVQVHHIRLIRSLAITLGRYGNWQVRRKGMLPNILMLSPGNSKNAQPLATACEVAYWKPGTFISAFNENREDVIEHVIEADPVANTLRSFIQEQSNRVVRRAGMRTLGCSYRQWKEQTARISKLSSHSIRAFKAYRNIYEKTGH